MKPMTTRCSCWVECCVLQRKNRSVIRLEEVVKDIEDYGSTNHFEDTCPRRLVGNYHTAPGSPEPPCLSDFHKIESRGMFSSEAPRGKRSV